MLLGGRGSARVRWGKGRRSFRRRRGGRRASGGGVALSTQVCGRRILINQDAIGGWRKRDTAFSLPAALPVILRSLLVRRLWPGLALELCALRGPGRRVVLSRQNRFVIRRTWALCSTLCGLCRSRRCDLAAAQGLQWRGGGRGAALTVRELARPRISVKLHGRTTLGASCGLLSRRITGNKTRTHCWACSCLRVALLQAGHPFQLELQPRTVPSIC